MAFWLAHTISGSEKMASGLERERERIHRRNAMKQRSLQALIQKREIMQEK